MDLRSLTPCQARQDHFARLIAQGMPASQAAYTAGYSFKTAQHNAARLAAGSHVASLIATYRRLLGNKLGNQALLPAVVDALMAIITNPDAPASAQIQATHKLGKIMTTQVSYNALQDLLALLHPTQPNKQILAHQSLHQLPTISDKLNAWITAF